ncbi:hypothetical protein F5878DRAFT_659943 [Lentinula raphanica]|uniref:Uncharacterized protein n=1 Tax=Lentinula raphanica TaxID=153919 RepID=A0AA38UFP8_9AGAR|nr:hypothetical protein F5878DRAFT_659943 [Lentinula raphanica]
MVRSRPVFIFVALGAASIAAAAPLRLAPSVEPAGQEAASCTRFDRDTADPGNPQDCVESEFNHNVSIGEYNVLDMNAFHSSRDFSGIAPLPSFDSPSSQDDDTSAPSIESRASHSSGLFDSPSSQEHEDADTISDPSISSRAPHPSGPFYSPSSQEHVDAITADVPGIESRAPHPSGPFYSPWIQERANAYDTASVPGIVSRAPQLSGPFDSQLSQERADVDDTSAPDIESHASHPSGPFNFSSSRGHKGADTANVLAIKSRAPHPSGLLYSPSIQERADADDTAGVPGIASRALHRSGLLEYFRRSLGVLSLRSSNAPLAHSRLQKRTDTEIPSVDDPDSPATLRISVPLQPTSTFSTSFPSVVASPDQRQDSREEKDAVTAAHSIVSRGPNSSGSPHPSAVSDAHTLVQENIINTDTASAHIIESRSPKPAGPTVVGGDMRTYHFVYGLSKVTFAKDVRNHIKSKCESYEQDVKVSSWKQFEETKSGQSWVEIDQLLSTLHPRLDRDLVRLEITADILDNVTNWKLPMSVYKQLRDWSPIQYSNDAKASTNINDWMLTKTGKLYLQIEELITPRCPGLDCSIVSILVEEDIRGLSADEKADVRLNKILTSTGEKHDDVAAALRLARNNMNRFRNKGSACLTRFKYWKDLSTSDVAASLEVKLKEKFKEAEEDKLVLPPVP